jgi:hypothetical protein
MLMKDMPGRRLSVLTTDLGGDFRRCLDDAVRRHEMGDLFLRVQHFRTYWVSSTPRVSGKTRECVEGAVRRLIDVETAEPRDRIPLNRYFEDLAVGAPGPLLPRPDDLLPAWRRWARHPWFITAGLLTRQLPPEVELGDEGCLRIADESYGSNIMRSLGAWLSDLGAKEVSPGLFQVAPGVALGVLDDGERAATLCLHPMSHQGGG